MLNAVASDFVRSGHLVVLRSTTRPRQTRLKKAVRQRLKRMGVILMTEEDMWRYKRESQRRDIAALIAGTMSDADVNWFAGGIARYAKILGQLF